MNDFVNRTVGNAAFELRERRIDVPGIKIHKAKRAIGEFGNGLQHLVVFPAKRFGRGIGRQLHPHVNAKPLDSHAVGNGNQFFQTLLGSAAGVARDVAMKIPDSHGVKVSGRHES